MDISTQSKVATSSTFDCVHHSIEDLARLPVIPAERILLPVTEGSTSDQNV